MKITYLKHSGFAVELQNRLLLFDAITLPDAQALAAYRAVYFFVSHVHSDHFNKDIFALAADNVHYILSSEIRAPRSSHFLKKGEHYADAFLRCDAGGSTDIGVSFVVEAAGKRLFHAGDLNCWHWTGDWSKREEDAARAAYHAELDFLASRLSALDVAFLPVDARMKGDYAEGAREFAQRFRPKTIIPMHLWGDYAAADRFAAEMKGFSVATYAREGETILH